MGTDKAMSSTTEMLNSTVFETKIRITKPKRKSEQDYPTLCVCLEQKVPIGNFWKNACCPCLTTKKMAAAVGESSASTNCWCWGTIFCAPCINHYARGAVLTSKLRKKYGFEARPCRSGCAHCWCTGCALTQDQYLMEHHAPVEKTS